MAASRTEYLLEQHFNGVATGDEGAELSRMLMDDGGATQAFWQMAGFEYLTHCALELEQDGSAPTEDGVWSRLRDLASNYVALSLLISGLVMANLLLSMALIVPDWGRSTPNVAEADPPRPAVVAQVTSTHQASWDASSDANFKNIELFAGERLILNGGLAVIEYVTGARVVLEGPAVYQLKGRNEGVLKRGKVIARADTDASRGFGIAIPGARIVDTGTEFGIDVAPDRGDVTVFEGSVELQRGDQVVALAAGRSATVSPLGEVVLDGAAVRSLSALRDRMIVNLARNDAQPLPSRFVLFEDWEEMRIGESLHEQGQWRTLPPSTGNVKVFATDAERNLALRFSGLSKGGQERGFYKSIGHLGMVDGATSTMYLRLKTSGGEHETHFGLSDAGGAIDSDFELFTVQLAVDGLSLKTPEKVLAELEEDAWHHLWIVVDHAADTFDVYIQGEAFASQTQVAAKLPFRRGTAASLQSFYALTPVTPSAGSIFLDDIYLAAGERLEVPPAVTAESGDPQRREASVVGFTNSE